MAEGLAAQPAEEPPKASITTAVDARRETVDAQGPQRHASAARSHPRPRLYTLVPAPDVDPSVAQRLPVTVRCERDLGIGSQVWVQHECWELVERHPTPDDTPQRAAFLCATSPTPRARILAGPRESSLYEPDLLDLIHGVRHVHADETPTTRTIQTAIGAALHGGAAVDANLDADALHVLAQAIRGIEIRQGLSPTLQELGSNLNQHFDDLGRIR
jgi:hypothetical protein